MLRIWLTKPIDKLECRYNWEWVRFQKFTRNMEDCHYGHDGVSNHRRLDFFYQTFVHVEINQNIKDPRHRPFWGEFSRERGIPLTKGQ